MLPRARMRDARESGDEADQDGEHAGDERELQGLEQPRVERAPDQLAVDDRDRKKA